MLDFYITLIYMIVNTKKGTINVTDMDSYLYLDNEVFQEAWNKGSLSDYVPNCRWNNEAHTYTITR